MIRTLSKPAYRRWGLGILGTVAVVVGGLALWTQLPALSSITVVLADASLGWVLAALTAQAMAVLSFAELQRHLVVDLGGHLSRGNSVELTLASGAISMAMPAGSAFGAGYTYRRMQRAGLRSADIGVTMIASAGVLTLSLILLYVVLAGPALLDELAEIIGRDQVGSLFVLALAIGLLVILKPSHASRTPGDNGQVPAGRIAGYVATSMTAARSIPTHAWMSSAAWAVVKWTADFAVLVFATYAVGANVDGANIDLVALATIYVGVQVVRQIPLTPGGIGIVEAALLAGLIAAGAAAAPATAAVVIYRVLTFWLVLPAGGLAVLLAGRSQGSDQPGTEASRSFSAPSSRAPLSSVSPSREPTEASTRAPTSRPL